MDILKEERVNQKGTDQQWKWRKGGPEIVPVQAPTREDAFTVQRLVVFVCPTLKKVTCQCQSLMSLPM